MTGKNLRAFAYLRTSSQANVNGDSSERQRQAIQSYATAHRITIAGEYYDKAVSGADPIDTRPGFSELARHMRDSGVDTILVETASRFARDLIVQETGHALLRERGITLIAADDPDAFTGDTPTAVMVRQILGAVAQFDKAMTVDKLRGARDRASDRLGHRIEGRKANEEIDMGLAKAVRRLARKSPKTARKRTARQIAAELADLGYVNSRGSMYGETQIRRMVSRL